MGQSFHSCDCNDPGTSSAYEDIRWGKVVTKDGVAHDVTWYPTGSCNPGGSAPYECFRDWGDPTAGGICYYGCPATAATSGTISVSRSWNWAYGNPPPYLWIKETATAYAQGSSVYGCDMNVKGWATNSLGGSCIPGGDPLKHETKYTSSCVRYTRVKSSSGQFTRVAGFFAGAVSEPVFGCNQRGGVSAYCSFDVEFSDGVPDSEKPDVNVAPPGRDGAPHDPVFRPRWSVLEGATGEAGDPVNLATGAHADMPAPDIAVYNPYGPNVVYRRNFYTEQSKAGHASPGLSVGWVDSYDVKVSAPGGTWGGVTLSYPNGAEETLTPVLSGGQPTGELSVPAGAPYLATGIPGGTAGQWQSITLVFIDETKWVFSPSTANDYLLSRIVNRIGRYVSIMRDAQNGYRVSSVRDDSEPVDLLTFSYSGSWLASVTDVYGRQVSYSFGAAAATDCLLSVSQIVPAGASNPPAQWSYGYVAVGSPSRPYLASLTFPSPTGVGNSTQSIQYYSESDSYVDSFSYSKVKRLVDANGNRREYIYRSNAATEVRVKRPFQSPPEPDDPDDDTGLETKWVENFDPTHGNRTTGMADADSHYTSMQYDDTNNPSKPTAVVDKNHSVTRYTYDQHGHISKITNARGTATEFSYDYSDFQLGRLHSVQEGSKTPTTFSYYPPESASHGLLQRITGARPGTTDGSTVYTEFSYDTLGNVLTVDSPGNNRASRIVTTYNYTSDGGFSQSAKRGEPLTVTDNLGNVTHFRYDARGNVVSIKDALDYETNFIHNLADQPSLVIQPATAP